jgi:hypothetical protein
MANGDTQYYSNVAASVAEVEARERRAREVTQPCIRRVTLPSLRAPHLDLDSVEGPPPPMSARKALPADAGRYSVVHPRVRRRA